MKKISRLSAIVMMCTLILTAVPFLSEPAGAETLPGYSADAAITFAQTNTHNYKDCVKFARACAEKGGVPRQNAITGYSTKSYMDYLINFGYAVKNELTLHPADDAYVPIGNSKKICNLLYEDNAGDLAPGDLLVYKCKKCGKYYHSAIVTGIKDTVTRLNDQGSSPGWMLEAQSANGKLIEGPFYLYNHKSAHGRTNVTIYALHFTSADNGFEACDTTIGSLTAKKITSKKVRLKWDAIEGAVAYNIYTRGYSSGPIRYLTQVKGTNVKVAVPKNSKGKYYKLKNVRYTVAPVFEKEVTFESKTKVYRVIGKRRALVKVK